jgi:hypothetical protein
MVYRDTATSENNNFIFDRILTPAATQQQVYDAAVAPIVDDVMLGCAIHCALCSPFFFAFLFIYFHSFPQRVKAEPTTDAHLKVLHVCMFTCVLASFQLCSCGVSMQSMHAGTTAR